MYTPNANTTVVNSTVNSDQISTEIILGRGLVNTQCGKGNRDWGFCKVQRRYCEEQNWESHFLKGREVV